MAIVCLLSLTATADISRISPSSIPYGDSEGFLSIFGTDLSGTESTLVLFDGPAGQFFVQPTNSFPNDDPEAPPQFPSDRLDVFIPGEVAVSPGPYSVFVVAKNVGEDARTLGPITFNVEDLRLDGPPVMAYTETVYQDATNTRGAEVSFDVAAYDPGSGNQLAVTCTPPSGSFFTMGTTIVTCSASNAYGTSIAEIVVIVVDLTNPIVNVPDDIVTDDAVVTYSVTATDAIDGNVPVTCTPASGSTFGPGVTQVVCEATDSNGNTGIGIFYVRRSGGLPVLTVPADITVTSADGNPVNVPYDVSATNNADILCYPSGFSFAVGTTTVTCTATNFTGVDTKSFNVRVNNGAAPTVIIPANITAEATSPAGAVVTFTASGTNDSTVVCTPASGSTFALGQTTVTCTATNAGGSDSASFTITVVDTTAPTLILPADITAEATSAAGAAVTYVARASDLADADVAVQCTPASGATFALGTTIVNCSATDDSGNTSTGSFDVNVVDSTPPQILSVEASPNVLWPPNHQMVDVGITVVAIDAVDPTPVSRILSVSSNQPVNGTGDGDTAPDWQLTGPLSLKLRSERSQGVDRVYTITIQTVDDAGNASTATVTVTVTQGRRRSVR